MDKITTGKIKRRGFRSPGNTNTVTMGYRISEKIFKPIRIHGFQLIHSILELFPTHLMIMYIYKITFKIGNSTVLAGTIGRGL